MAETKYPTYKISNKLLQKIEEVYSSQWGVSPGNDPGLAKAVEWTSNFYIHNPTKQSPWHDPRFQKAYLTYYFIKNHIRCLGVVDRLRQVDFFSNTTQFTEFGSGNGAFLSAYLERFSELESYSFLERDDTAVKQAESLLSTDTISRYQRLSKIEKPNTLVLSYSLTETEVLPECLFDAENILILEPSTNQDGRRLMELRKKFIDKSYYAWAPCTHQASCPLLEQSKKDWCHDSFYPEYPEFLTNSLKNSPMTTSRISTSYLAVSKRPPKVKFPEGVARVVGHPQDERGKRKQMLCRGEEREFLSWFTKREPVAELNRGDLVVIPKDSVKKSNEIRKLEGLKTL